MPDVPAVNMPNVHMPKMPELPKMPDLFGKKQTPEEAAAVGENGAEGQQIDASKIEPAQEQQPQVDQQQQQDVPSTSAAAEAADAANAEQTGEAASGGSKFGINAADISQNAQKAIGNAKELGSNIGSK